MYNKIFTKILDSSIWLEPTPTRIVWVTLIAAMDETGFCAFAAPGNVAARARVSEEEARIALATLEAPDPNSFDPANEGKRIERLQGGWMVLNAEKYRNIVTRAHVQETTRERVAKWRAKQKSARNADVTKSNVGVTGENAAVTPSEAYSETEAKKELPLLSFPEAETTAPKIRPEEFANTWNRLRGNLPKVEKFTDERRRKVVARIKSGVTIDRFSEAIECCKIKPFLRGDNDRGWTASFDWLIDNSTNLEKAINHPYGRKGGNADGEATRQAAAEAIAQVAHRGANENSDPLGRESQR